MYNSTQKVGLLLGPILFILVLLLPLPAGMQPAALKALAVTALMATWWFTEAIPIPATSLLPIALFPALQISSAAAATAPYANHLIYLFMGGFFLALCMERWNLHRRIALTCIKIVGTKPKRIILGFMAAAGFLSMGLSNTATCMMMVPIAMAVINQAILIIKEQNMTGIDTSPTKFQFGTAMMLGIAYACSIGGIGTIIGSPPNAILVGIMEKNYHQEISFLQWMIVGIPIAVVMLLLTWFYLTHIGFRMEIDELPGGKALIDKELKALGPISTGEKGIFTVFGLVALAWMTRDLFMAGGIFETPALFMIQDSTIAMIGAVLLFAIPINLKEGVFLMDWKTGVKAPWGIILLFGGGLSLADAFSATGLATWIGAQFSIFGGLPLLALIGVVVFIAIFLTEITSNTATASMLLPILASTAISMAIHPIGLVMGAGLAVSFAFMLPIATPPNAVVFGSEMITMPQMAKTGFWLNILGTVLITVYIYYALPLLWGIDLASLPDWAIPKP